MYLSPFMLRPSGSGTGISHPIHYVVVHKFLQNVWLHLQVLTRAYLGGLTSGVSSSLGGICLAFGRYGSDVQNFLFCLNISA